MPTLPLSDALDAANFVGLAIWRGREGWCASVERVDGEWSRDSAGACPSEALEALFAPKLPPLPY